MKWLLKLLSALARPLGISSPEDLRGRAGPMAGKKPALRAEGDRTSGTKPPKSPTTTR